MALLPPWKDSGQFVSSSVYAGGCAVESRQQKPAQGVLDACHAEVQDLAGSRGACYMAGMTVWLVL